MTTKQVRYEEKMTTALPREVLKWIQSLDLTWQVKSPKWDLTNGYLVAEIFSWYFPQDIQMHSYNNGTSLDSKLKNWSLLKLFIKRHKLDIPEELVEGTVHCKEGASTCLTERIYEILTNRKVRKLPPTDDVDFTDSAYQNRLPMHARSTASKAVKNNLRITEIMADQNLILSAQKRHKYMPSRSQKIINEHIEHRRQQRYTNPGRFNVKPTLGERSLRRPPPQPKQMTYETDRTQEDAHAPQDYVNDSGEQQAPFSREPSVQFKEIQVNQVDKAALYNMPVQGF